MGQTLYLECDTGISGDMMVAALLDLGADQEVLQHALDSLPVQGFEIKISRAKKAGLDVCDFDVKLDAAHENHDHDMEYLYGHTHGGQSHEHEHGSHDHDHAHGHHHEHRGLPEILAIIDAAAMTDRAKDMARRIFAVLAEAEAKAHGVPADQVHFHEVGAIDSIVDILAVAVCLDNLDITETVVPCLCEGRGTVRCQHGILPVPVPAVANIVQKYQIPLHITETEGELVTPTGAAVAAAIRTSGRLPERFVIRRIGIGAGKRNYENPSLLRAMLIEAQGSAPGMPRDAEGGRQAVPASETESFRQADCIYKLETNVDDCTGEALGHVMDRLMESGARDVHFVPVYMKKHRPAYELCVICGEEKVSELEQIIFEETTTIGIRKIPMERTVLKREADTVTLPCGELAVKKCTLPNGQVRRYPEYESVAKLAKAQGISFWQMMELFYHAEEEDAGGAESDAEAWL